MGLDAHAVEAGVESGERRDDVKVALQAVARLEDDGLTRVLNASGLEVKDRKFEAGVGAAYGLRKATWPVSGCASVTKKDMVFNDATPLVKVDPESYAVTADGELLTCAPARILPLAQRYQLF